MTIKTKLVSDKKEKLLQAFEASKPTVGDIVYVADKWIRANPTGRIYSCEITKIINDQKVEVRELEYAFGVPVVIYIENINTRLTEMEIGENPFVSQKGNVQFTAFTLESIIFNLNVLGTKDTDPTVILGVNVPEINWNPFVYDKDGNKLHYQRPFVWTLEDNQLLLESVYMGIECGRILIRERSWEFVESEIKKGNTTNIAFFDIVDGKQRLNAIRGFVLGEYPDSRGNYFSDLSTRAQQRFTNHQQFSYATLSQTTTDEDTIAQFLRLNFAGVPQSKDHIDFVKSIHSKL